MFKSESGEKLYKKAFTLRPFKKRFECFLQAAQKGYAPAQNIVAGTYLRIGLDDGDVSPRTRQEIRQTVPLDSAKGLYWLEKAASQDHEDSQWMLADLYSLGSAGGSLVEAEVPINYVKSVQWFTALANRGKVEAQIKLGLIYAEGKKGVPKNLENSKYWLKRAEAQGHPLARESLKKIETKEYLEKLKNKQPLTDEEMRRCADNILSLTDNPSTSSSSATSSAAPASHSYSSYSLPSYPSSPSFSPVVTPPTLPPASPYPPSPQPHYLPPVTSRPKAAPLPPTPAGYLPSSLTPQSGRSFIISYKELALSTEIGRGGFGVVFKGTWQRNPVAIKTLSAPQLSPKDVEDFKSEASIMFNLRHPNILQLFGITVDQNAYCMVMELMENGSLYGYLQTTKPMDIATQLQIALDITQGLLYLHSQRPPVLHRDLKSLNVLLDSKLHAKIGDFGLSKVRNHTLSMTAGKMVGSPQWMAPELFDMDDSKNKGNEKSDMYSYGIILWELASRKVPFSTARDPMQVGMWVMQGKRETIPTNCSPTMKKLIQECWEADPNRRPTAQKALEQLQTVSSAMPSMPSYAGVSPSLQPSTYSYQGNLTSLGSPSQPSAYGSASRGAVASSNYTSTSSSSPSSGPYFFSPSHSPSPAPSYAGNLASLPYPDPRLSYYSRPGPGKK